MPLYDFECRKCGERFEDIADVDCTGGEVCPNCASTETTKLMSAHGPLPGSGPNRIPGSLLRGGGAKMERVNLPPRPKNAPSGCSGCPSGGCGSSE